MNFIFTILLSIVSIVAFTQRDVNKLKSSSDFGFGNSFGLRQISEGYKSKNLAVSNFTFGWTNYFTNNKIGGRFELSSVRLVNSSKSLPFHTNYFRSTAYLNANIKNIIGWGRTNKAVINKKIFWQMFDCDLGMGLGYSFMKSKQYPSGDNTFLSNADDMFNVSFRICPSIEISEKVKLFTSFTIVNHSAQSVTFDFTNSIVNTAFKGSLRTLNIGIRIIPETFHYFSRDIKYINNKLRFFTTFDASFGIHFAGKTKVESNKFKSSSISHFNIGANHKYPNSRYLGRFDVAFDLFKEAKNESSFNSKYIKTTYQIIADMRSLGIFNNESSNMDLAFGLGLGFAINYNENSLNNLSDNFLNGDDMYALVFSINPSYRISKSISLMANATFNSHSLQSSGFDLQNAQTNTALNGRFFNMSFGLRYYLNSKRYGIRRKL